MSEVPKATAMADQQTLQSLEFPQLLTLLADWTQTPQGMNLALSLLPTQDYSEMVLRLDHLSEYMRFCEDQGSIHFDGIKNYNDHFIQLATPGAILSAEEILDIQNILILVDKINSLFKRCRELTPILQDMISRTQSLPSLIKLIDKSISPDAEIRDDATPELKKLRASILKNRDKIYRSLERFSARNDIAIYIQDNVVTQRNQRFVIPIKVEGKSKIRGIIHDQSSSGATLFIEPMNVMPLNNAFLQDKLAEEKEIKRILKQISSLCRENLEILKINVEVLSQLDFIQAKGLFANHLKASRPQISSKPQLALIDARHPLLMHFLGEENVVSVDIIVNKQERLLLITGPNMGGKTVALKTAGLLSLMVQSGLFIPASERSLFPVFQSIYTDIGDLQDISQSLSTFASHLMRIKTILDNAGDTSLVLLDELGTGTDPDEGSALGQMILDEMFNRQAITIATTHLSHLKQRTFQTSEDMVASVQFDLNSAQPTYKLVYGECGDSNAFTIAQNLGIHPKYINKAKQFLDPVQTRLNELAKVLEQKQNLIEKREIKIAKRRKAINRSIKDAEKKAKEILLDARQQSQNLLKQVQDRIRHLHKELTEKSKNEDIVQQTDSTLSSISAEIDILVPEPELIPKPDHEHIIKTPSKKSLQIGDSVQLEGVGKTGTVIELKTHKNIAVINISGMTMSVPLETLQSVDRIEQTGDTIIEIEKAGEDEVVLNKLSLLGNRVDEALMKLDRYLNDAILFGHVQVSIIHGIGEEKLRPAIHQYLSDSPMVNSFRSGDQHEGGFGVTVIELINA